MSSFVATITLYQTNGPGLVISRAPDDAWALDVAGDHMAGMFVRDAQAWAGGDWEPCEADHEFQVDLSDELREVATWDAEHGLRLLAEPAAMGFAARDYLGVSSEGNTNA
ncbi:hypothetical protein ETD86_40950 [Nonomuraea turkmeniaca]|uniref:Uncharacterized protein n=1 Tax=Nonomuraea turkmeniaca TaxID=103838 RepID=A0A5S4F1X6_9ACTN|nr:hypothetical protein [Nonomuraea turkmeniaca]TMR10096.1 hypothetical protein ETD86_40950 [Nonomuraea turkmeniaca]